MDTAIDLDGLLGYMHAMVSTPKVLDFDARPAYQKSIDYLRQQIERRIGWFREELRGEKPNGIAERDMAALADYYETHVKNAKPEDITERPAGRMYQTALHVDPERLLDWDRPLAQQPQAVQDALRSIAVKSSATWRQSPSEPNLLELTGAHGIEGTVRQVEGAHGTEWLAHYNTLDGQGSARFPTQGEARAWVTTEAPIEAGRGAEIVRQMQRVMSDVEVSAALHKAGIEGIRYLDAGSRGAGEGSHNYVVFDDKLIDIERKFGRRGNVALGRRQTDTPEFRNWFGDSRVVDAAGEPKRMYHGSREPGIEAFSRERASPEAMYGPGFYFTDNPDVAGSTGGGKDEHEIAAKAAFNQAGYAWQAARYDSAPLTPRQMARAKRLLWSKPVLYDAHQDIGTRQTTAAGQRAVLAGEPQFREWLNNGGWRWLRETLGVEREPTTRPTTYPVYLSIKQPFEADQRITAAAARGVVKAALAGAPREGLPAWRAGEGDAAIERRIQGWGDAVPQSAVFEAAAAELGNSGAMAALQRAGYDGVHMEGGATVGTFGKHDVWIAFDPTQIKSAVGNVGTFDPNDPRLAFGRKPTQSSLPMAAAKERFAVAKKAADEVKQLFAPTSRGREAKATEHMIRSHAAQRAQSVAQSTEALERFVHVVGRLPVDEQLAITDRAEAGQPQPTPELNKILDAVRAEQEKWVGKVRSLGPQYLKTLRENYMGRIWANYREWRAGVDADAAQQMAEGRGIAEAQARGKSPLKGSGAFLKQRTFDTQREGMEAGLIPVTTNPIEMQLLKLYEMARFYHGVRLSDAIKESGLAAWVPFHDEGYIRERGFVKLDDPTFQPRVVNEGEYGRKEFGNWYAPEPVARVFNNFVSRGLAGRSTIYDAIRGASNALNSAQLSFSGFHATFVAFDTMMSKMGLGLQQLLRGEPLRGAATMAKSLSPTTIASTVLKGAALREAYLHPDQATPEMRKLVHALLTAGGRIKMDPFYQSTAAGSFVKRLGDLAHPGAILHDAWQMAKDSPVAAPMRIVGRLLDTLNHPLMGVMVPRAKLGVFSELAADFLRRNPDATQEQLADAMTKAWDSVDNRMGQLVYDNLFWSKLQKDLAFITTRSVGWNLGSVREIGGGIVDLAAQGARTAKGIANVARGKPFGIPPELTNRMAYTIAMPIITAMFGALVTYLMTGQGPQELLDLFYPPTGQGDRTTMPGYIKDVMAFKNDPLGTIGNKTQPLAETVIELAKNRDYYGGIINMPGVDNPLVSYPEYLLNQAIPFSWRGWMKSREESGSMMSQALNFWGIQPAPQSITNPERGEVYDLRQQKRGYRAREKENARGRINFDSAP